MPLILNINFNLILMIIITNLLRDVKNEIKISIYFWLGIYKHIQ